MPENTIQNMDLVLIKKGRKLMTKTEVIYCQYKTCDGCRKKNVCKYKRREPKQVTTRTCKECGFVNGSDDLNCKRCDHPLVI